MSPGQQASKRKAGFAAAAEMPGRRTVPVRSTDGTRLHTEVFGPDDGYPIVLSHGITCAIRVWAYQIADLAGDYRVIAFDHRGHGRSDVPKRVSSYTLDHLADDLDAVLEATLAPGERATIAGHSMGGITITSWAYRYRHKVAQRADAVALINTTTGQLLEEVNLLRMPSQLAATRVAAASRILRRFAGLPVVHAVDPASRWFIAAMAVGRDADPGISAFVHELFAGTPRQGRGGCAANLIDSLGPQHLDLTGLTVPTLVIGSRKDRLLPLVSSRRIAMAAPNLAGFVELTGGHCSILERPREVNQQLRALVESVSEQQAASS